MKTYYVEDINLVFGETQKILANSPIEAVKKAYPNHNVSRDNFGNIVVGNWHNGYYGAVYKRYVYRAEAK